MNKRTILLLMTVAFLSRLSKAWLHAPLLWCMNFPDCCDIKGKDMCGFACPICPIKVDFCKFDIIYALKNLNFVGKFLSNNNKLDI